MEDWVQRAREGAARATDAAKGEGGLDVEIDRLVGEMRGVRAELDALED